MPLQLAPSRGRDRLGGSLQPLERRLEGAIMSVQVTPHPAWVAELDATLEPHREAILDTPVIVHASEYALINGKIQDFLVAFYPIIRDFPQWLQTLLDRSPEDGKVFFRDNIRVERDRKSTRLNSSHLVISYAVFCLKKKKKRKCSA